MPAELVIELANHPNIAAIKESSGNLDKVKAMLEGTNRIKRQATVTETFHAVTPRMLRAAASAAKDKQEKESRELVSVASLAGASSGAVRTSPVGTSNVKTGNVKTGDPARPAERSSATPSSAAVSVVGALKTRQKEVGFQVLVGAAHQLEPSLALGATGAILAFACPAPTACYEIYAAIREDDLPLAREKQDRVKPAAQQVVSDLGVPGIKYAMDLNGYYGGPARLPFLPLTGDQKKQVEEAMSNLRN
jgi:dihydrodipicolinate synthase/N-acetylneuraminate lyase